MRDFQRGQSALGARTVGGSTTVEVVKVDEKNAGDGGAFPPFPHRLLLPWPEVDSYSLTHPFLTNISCRPAERGTKRKFELDASELDRLAQAAEDAAMVKISSEQAEARKAKLPAFWLPSLAPVAGKEKVKVVKLETMCQASEHPHPLKCVPQLCLPACSSRVSDSPSWVSSCICCSQTKELDRGQVYAPAELVDFVHDGGQVQPVELYVSSLLERVDQLDPVGPSQRVRARRLQKVLRRDC